MPTTWATEVRPPSGIFPSPLPATHAFLASPLLNRRINFRHPAYKPENDLLFSLYAWDHPDGGLEHGLAHTACAIVAANRYDGYLSESRQGTGVPISSSSGDILRGTDYYFHVPNHSSNSDQGPYRWPVVPSFQDWQCPPSLPDPWLRPYYPSSYPIISSQSTLTAAVRGRDRTCRITNHASGTEVAHLCPAHERDWFLRNSMDKWNRDTSLDPDNLCKDMNNLILLRSDLHTVFDERIFVLFPKSDKGFVVHMLEQSPDLAQLYHNVEVHPLQCSPYFIFARFAWALFPSLSGFLSRPNVSRYLRILKTSSTGAEYIEEEVIGAAKLQATLSASRSRSPKKRQRAAEQQDNNTEDGTTRSRKKQRQGSESSSEPSVEISREDFERMNIPRTSWTADQRLKYTKMELSEEQLAKIELEEDLEFQREKFPHFAEFGHPNNPPAWYPGWRRVQRLKNSWVAETRPPSFIDKREDTNSESMEKDVTRFYESIGVEILDDLDSVCMDSVCMDSVC